MTGHRYRPDRPSKAQKVTFCPTCERTVGVWKTPFNVRVTPSAYSVSDNPKISIHKGLDGRRCTSSGVAISPNVVMDRVVDK